MADISITYWIVLIIIALIFGVIGFYLGKSRANKSGLHTSLEELQTAHSQLQRDYDQCQDQLNRQSTVLSQHEFKFDADAARRIFGRFIKQDDLKIVEGIGPKIEGLFHNYNIKTWKALSTLSVRKCREVLESGGEKYRVHDPASWPMQARMCYEGKWKELYRWQEEHKHGKL